MDTPLPALVPEGLIALPGRVLALASSPAGGVLAAGDDRGEIGVWDTAGARLVAERLSSPVASAHVSADGFRQAFAGADGEILVVSERGRSVARLRGPRGAIVLCDAGSPRIFVIDRTSGRVELRDAAGTLAVAFQVPAPVAGAVVVPRTGGIAVVTPSGVIARFGGWGQMLWGADFARSTARIACDAEGRELWLSLLARGAEVLSASSGSRLRVIDTGRPVDSISVGARRVAIGCADGYLALLDRSGARVAESVLPSRPHDVALLDADDSCCFARLADGFARLFGAAVPAAGPAPAPQGVPPAPPAPRVPLGDVQIRAGSPLVAIDAATGHTAVAAGRREVLVLDEDGTPAARSTTESAVLAVGCASQRVTVATATEIRVIAAGKDRQAAHFVVENRAAAVSPCGNVVARADEIGMLHLTDSVTGEARAEAAAPRGRTVTSLAAQGEAFAAAEIQGIGVLLYGPGWERPVRGHDEVARLAFCGPDGPVVVTSRGVHAHGWDAVRRWSFPAAGPAAAYPVAGGAVVIVTPTEAALVDREGRALCRFRPPEGTPVSAAGSGPADVVVAARAGRLLSFASASGPAGGHHFGAEVLDARLIAPGRGVVVLAGHLTWIGAPAARPGTEPSREREEDRTSVRW